MSTQTAVLTIPKPKPAKTGGQGNFREYGLMIALVVIMVFFQFMTSGTLFKPLNLTNLVLQNSYVIIMALGMLLVIVAGHIDLSVGSVVGFVGALAAVLMVQMGMHFVPATLICLAAGAAITAAFTRGSCAQSGIGNGAGSNSSPPWERMNSQSGAAGNSAQSDRKRRISGTPPIATRVANPPREKPNMPMRFASSRPRSDHSRSI